MIPRYTASPTHPLIHPSHQHRLCLPFRFPTHLIEPMVRSFRNDHYVEDKGDVVFYKKDPNFPSLM